MSVIANILYRWWWGSPSEAIHIMMAAGGAIIFLWLGCWGIVVLMDYIKHHTRPVTNTDLFIGLILLWWALRR